MELASQQVANVRHEIRYFCAVFGLERQERNDQFFAISGAAEEPKSAKERY